MKPHSMEEKISYRLFLMGFLGLLFTAALCIFVFHRAFTAQAWDDLEKESDLVRAGYDLTSEPQQLSAFVTGDLRITLISPDGDVIFESATDQPMENHLTRPEIARGHLQGGERSGTSAIPRPWATRPITMRVRLPGGDVLRVAQDAETVWSVYDASHAGHRAELRGADAGCCGAGRPADPRPGAAGAEHDRGSGPHSG